jgi:tRNA dimethylallyltransferase
MRKLYFILGCTAGGKGTVGRELASRLGAQIISVDSMKIYRRMDIGTAKPSAQVRAAIPHHCLDLVEPSESFSVARYVEHADRAAGAIRAAGSIPLAVGGTSLYIKALTEGLFEGPAADAELRARLQERARTEGLAALHAELVWKDPQAGARIHPNDQKRIIRALEVHGATGQTISRLQTQWDAGQRRYDCVMVGLRREKEDLHRRINLRVKRMIDAGLRDEAAALLAEPNPPGPQAAQAVGYAEMFEHLRGRCSLEDAVEAIKINTRHLAKKQRTWQRRWTDVIWIDCAPDDEPAKTADEILKRVAFE